MTEVPRPPRLPFALVLAVFLGASFPGVLVGARTFFFRDFGTLAYPVVRYFREAFWRGELPLWNPLTHCGAPFLAQWNTLVMYPGSLVYLLPPLPWSLNLFCLLHLYLAGLGMYRLARDWTEDDFAAAFAGLAFAFSGAMLTSHIYPNYLVALGWMPWVVRSARIAWRSGGVDTLKATAPAAMQMLSGAPEIILQTWLVVLTLWVAEALAPRSNPARGLGRLSVIVLITTGLCAVQLLPFFALLGEAQRSSDYGGHLWALPPWGVAGFFLPLFGCFQTAQGVYLQQGQVFLPSTYLGLAPLALAILALRRARNLRARSLALVAGGCLLAAMAGSFPLYDWLREVCPLLGFVRFPVKLIFTMAFVVPLLAAGGISAITTSSGSAQRRELKAFSIVIAVVALIVVALAASALFLERPPQDTPAILRHGLGQLACLLACGAALALTLRPQNAHAIRQRVLRVGLLTLVWIDLLTHKPHLTPTLAPRVFAPLAAELAMPYPEGGRAFVSPRAERLLATRVLPDFEEDFIGARLAMWSNLNLLERIAKVNGGATLRPRRQAELEARLYASPPERRPSVERFLGVTRSSSPDNPLDWLSATNSLPLVTAGQRPIFADASNSLRTVLAPEFDPEREVVLRREARPKDRVIESRLARIGSTEASSHSVSAVVESPAPTYLVVAQTWYPAWKVYVDDRPATLLRANHAFQAVEVPEGRHQVRLKYVDWPFRLGLVISCATLLCVGLGLLLFRRKHSP